MVLNNRKFLLVYLFFITVNSYSDTFLVFGGKTGWIGKKVVQHLLEDHHTVICSSSRLENRQDIERELQNIKPDYIINCAGRTGVPNVDWCESNKEEALRSNVIGILTLIDIAFLYDIPVTNLGTGCIYDYDSTHTINSGNGFKEEDKPNFDGSFYSKTKAMLDELLLSYSNVLNLRLRMPISSEYHPRNFITKITKYKKVINIPNSMTVLDDLIPVLIDMTLKGVRGNFNFTNPGTISHNEILNLYKEYIDPLFSFTNFTIEEQNMILKAKRSNNELDVSKLLQLYPQIEPIKISMRRVFQKMKELNEN